MNKKLLLIIFIMSIVTSICLIGCNKVDNNTDKSSKTAEEEIQETNENKQDTPWYNKYSLETDKITIAIRDENYMGDKLKLTPVMTITDTKEVKKLIQLVDFSSWREAKPEEQYSGIPYYYIVFHNGTMVKIYDDVDYGGVMTYSEKDGFYKSIEGKGSLFTSKNLSAEINKLVEQHEKQK